MLSPPTVRAGGDRSERASADVGVCPSRGDWPLWAPGTLHGSGLSQLEGSKNTGDTVWPHRRAQYAAAVGVAYKRSVEDSRLLHESTPSL
jgi:hypothetical protein